MLSYQVHTHNPSSHSLSEQHHWGKLTSLNPNFKDIKLTKPIYTIGRGTGNDITIPDIRLSNFHCMITRTDDGTVTLEDKSLNGTYLNDKKIGNRKSKVLVSGDMIQILHGHKIPAEDNVSFCLSILPTEPTNLLKRNRIEEEYPSILINDKQIKSLNSHEIVSSKNHCVNCSRGLETKRGPGFQAFCKFCMNKWVNKVVNSNQLKNKVQEIVDHTLDGGDDRGLTIEFNKDPAAIGIEQEFDENQPDLVENQRVEVNLVEEEEPQNSRASMFEAYIPGTEIETTADSGYDPMLSFGAHREMITGSGHREKKMDKYYKLFKQFTSS